MSETTITVTDGDTTYIAYLATIKSTALGTNDHGIFDAALILEWPHGGVAFGGYALDGKPVGRGIRSERTPTAYGMDFITNILRTVGVDHWEQLRGSHILALFEGGRGSALGLPILGIASMNGDRVFNPAQHAAIWQARGRLD